VVGAEAELEMQVRAGGVPGRPDPSDALSGFHVLSVDNEHGGQVRVAGADDRRVVDADVVAVAAGLPAGFDDAYLAAGRRQYRVPAAAARSTPGWCELNVWVRTAGPASG